LKIGIISDSHGNRDRLMKALDHMGKADIIFHLGDFIRDSEYIRDFHQGRLYVVRGNCDIFVDSDISSNLMIDLEGKKIFATHGHRYKVKDGLNALYYKGLEIGADIVLFGHTHCSQIIRVDNMVMMNPGSVSRPRNTGNPTYGIIEIIKGNIKPDIIEFSTDKS
jgi:hypothetical protein